jgi:hypothetical protein
MLSLTASERASGAEKLENQTAQAEARPVDAKEGLKISFLESVVRWRSSFRPSFMNRTGQLRMYQLRKITRFSTKRTSSRH